MIHTGRDYSEALDSKPRRVNAPKTLVIKHIQLNEHGVFFRVDASRSLRYTGRRDPLTLPRDVTLTHLTCHYGYNSELYRTTVERVRLSHDLTIQGIAPPDWGQGRLCVKTD